MPSYLMLGYLMLGYLMPSYLMLGYPACKLIVLPLAFPYHDGMLLSSADQSDRHYYQEVGDMRNELLRIELGERATEWADYADTYGLESLEGLVVAYAKLALSMGGRN